VEGSICIVVATDAPLSGRQLNRIAKRAAMGLALTGASANNASGDFIVAFSNGRLVPRDDTAVRTLPELSDDFISPLFDATIEATEEAILNALCMATTVVGRDGNVSPAIPLDRLQEILRQHGRVR
jgi:D-aminopeptidase